jgi:outer membrane protein assembly factor BamB
MAMSTRRVTRTVLGLLALASAGCWVAPGQGPNRNAFNPMETTISVATVATLDVAWSADLGLTDTRDPVTVGTSVFVTSGRFDNGFGANVLTALDTATGAPRWRRPETGIEEELSSTVLIDGGRLLSGSGITRFGKSSAVLDAATGRSLGSGVEGFPHAERGALVAYHGNVFDPTNPPIRTFIAVGAPGAPVDWQATVDQTDGSPAQQPLTLGPDFVYLTGQGNRATVPGVDDQGLSIRAFPVSGPTASTCGPPATPVLACPAWATSLDGTAATSAVLSDDLARLYVGTDAGTVYALDAATGAVAWTTPAGGPVVAEPALAGGTLVVPTTAGSLVALDAATGGPLWSAPLGAASQVQPAIAGGAVFTGADDGSVDAFALAGCGAVTCAPLWSAELGSAITGAPAVNDGRLFVGTADGRLVAFEPA